jgi:hypothetical protein
MNKKGKTVVKPKKTKAVFGRVIRAYLDVLNIREINQYQVYVEGVDYNGFEIRGVFKKDFIKKGRLEIRVLGMRLYGLASNKNWAWVKPVGGYFQSQKPDNDKLDSRAEGIPIREMNLHYPTSYRKLVCCGKYQEQLKKSE